MVVVNLRKLRIHDRLEVLKALPSTKNEASRIWRGLAIPIGLSFLAELATKSKSSTAPLPRLDPLEVKDRPAHLGPADALESKSRSDMVKIAETSSCCVRIQLAACQITGPPAHKDVLSCCLEPKRVVAALLHMLHCISVSVRS